MRVVELPGVGELVVGDCVEGMRLLGDCEVDAIVTDPPYGLGFMGKKWDALPPGLDWARECLRVLKPGGHLVAFGGQRTIHRLTCALEDAGFDIRDQLLWLQWQGFPKSLNLGKATRKEARKRYASVEHLLGRAAVDRLVDEVAGRWDGWGTALKPAAEPAVLARRPLDGAYAANVLKHGVGGLNIDACRYPYGDRAWPGPQSEAKRWEAPRGGIWTTDSEKSAALIPSGQGRFPANVYHCPKAATSERERGLEHLTKATPGELTGGRAEGSAGLDSPRAGAGRTARNGRANTHPTVKPIALMRWLVRLVTPPGGLVLDPFLGSGTTAIAAGLEGVRLVGFEVSDEYATIAAARVAGWSADYPRVFSRA